MIPTNKRTIEPIISQSSNSNTRDKANKQLQNYNDTRYVGNTRSLVSSSEQFNSKKRSDTPLINNIESSPELSTNNRSGGAKMIDTLNKSLNYIVEYYQEQGIVSVMGMLLIP